MPKDLPGLYWDEAKNRYFPLSSRPKPVKIVKQDDDSPNSGDSDGPSPTRRRIRRSGPLYTDLSSSFNGMVSGQCWRRNINTIMGRAITQTSRKDTVEVPLHSTSESRITAFAAAQRPGFDETICFVGDNTGCIWSPQDPHDRSEFTKFTRKDAWTPDFCIGDSTIGCEITSFGVSEQAYIATSFGPANRILVVPHLETQGEAFLLDPGKNIHEIWNSNFQSNRLVLGADEKAVYYSDIASCRPLDSSRILKTGSDVFATRLHGEHLVYTGARNGTIMRWDLRQQNKASQRLFAGRFDTRPLAAQQQGQRSSVTHMQVVRDWQLLTSHMSGHLATYDLRFFREHNPLVLFSGHVNSLTRRLGICVDPQEDLLFAAGEDKRIRLWSLQNGELLSPTLKQLQQSSQPTSPATLFKTEFDRDISALQVTEAHGTQQGGMSLWVAEGRRLHQYHLGQSPSSDDF